jgi:EpsI family protein
MTGPRLGVVLLLLGASAVSTWRLHRPASASDMRLLAAAPRELAGWKGRDVRLDERQYQLLESRDVLYRSYRGAAGDVLACVAVAGPEGRPAHPPEICYRGQGWQVESFVTIDGEIGGRRRSLGELQISRGRTRLLVWSWYRVGAEETESWWREQWLAILARFAGRDDRVALLRFSTPLRGAREDDLRAGRTTLSRFLTDVLPPIEAALAAPPASVEAGK